MVWGWIIVGVFKVAKLAAFVRLHVNIAFFTMMVGLSMAGKPRRAQARRHRHDQFFQKFAALIPPAGDRISGRQCCLKRKTLRLPHGSQDGSISWVKSPSRQVSGEFNTLILGRPRLRAGCIPAVSRVQLSFRPSHPSALISLGMQRQTSVFMQLFSWHKV